MNCIKSKVRGLHKILFIFKTADIIGNAIGEDICEKKNIFISIVDLVECYLFFII